jgi:hypothetical protein
VKHDRRPLLLATSFFASLVLSCKPAAEEKITKSEVKPETMYCGGEVSIASVNRYFNELKAALKSDAPQNFNRFVNSDFSTIRNERYFMFRLKDVGAVTPARISRDDWQRIVECGTSKLDDAGWRGCMFDLGKVWFQGEGDSFVLIGINHDMQWKELKPS